MSSQAFLLSLIKQSVVFIYSQKLHSLKKQQVSVVAQENRLLSTAAMTSCAKTAHAVKPEVCKSQSHPLVLRGSQCRWRLCQSLSSVATRSSSGFLLDFISFPVIKGFTCAAAVTIGFGQVKVSVRRPSAVPAALPQLPSLCQSSKRWFQFTFEMI